MTPLQIVKRWIRANRAYQKDCNTRIGLKSPDAKRRKLLAEDARAFLEVTNLFDLDDKTGNPINGIDYAKK